MKFLLPIGLVVLVGCQAQYRAKDDRGERPQQPAIQDNRVVQPAQPQPNQVTEADSKNSAATNGSFRRTTQPVSKKSESKEQPAQVKNPTNNNQKREKVSETTTRRVVESDGRRCTITATETCYRSIPNKTKCKMDSPSVKPGRFGKLDLLFVVDASQTLQKEAVASSIDELLNQLPTSDVRIAVLPAHGGSISRSSGVLFKASDEPTVLDLNQVSISQVRSLLREKINGVDRLLNEPGLMQMSIYSLSLLTATPPIDVAKAEGFFREDAPLAIVLVSDQVDKCLSQEAEGKYRQDCRALSAKDTWDRLQDLKKNSALSINGLFSTDSGNELVRISNGIVGRLDHAPEGMAHIGLGIQTQIFGTHLETAGRTDSKAKVNSCRTDS